MKRPRLCRILVVDDDPGCRDMLTDMLQDASCVVSTAATGPAALQISAMMHPDLVVLDLILPIIDGSRVAQLLKERDPLIRILAISGAPDTLGRLGDVGIDAVLAKPFRLAELRQTVKQLRRKPEQIVSIANQASEETVA